MLGQRNSPGYAFFQLKQHLLGVCSPRPQKCHLNFAKEPQRIQLEQLKWLLHRESSFLSLSHSPCSIFLPSDLWSKGIHARILVSLGWVTQKGEKPIWNFWSEMWNPDLAKIPLVGITISKWPRDGNRIHMWFSRNVVAMSTENMFAINLLYTQYATRAIFCVCSWPLSLAILSYKEEWNPPLQIISTQEMILICMLTKILTCVWWGDDTTHPFVWKAVQNRCCDYSWLKFNYCNKCIPNFISIVFAF